MKGNKIKIMAVVFAVICFVFIFAIGSNIKFNSSMHKIELDRNILRGEVTDGKVAVKIAPRGYNTDELSAWYHSYHLPDEDPKSEAHHAVGTIYELEITNLTGNLISDWSADIYIPCDAMFNSGWNGTFELHQNTAGEEKIQSFKDSKFGLENIKLDYIYDHAVLLIPLNKGDYFTYRPSKNSGEIPIAPSAPDSQKKASQIIGFIMYVNDEVFDYTMTFSVGSIEYKMHRNIWNEKIFWVAVAMLWLWLMFVFSMILTSIRTKKVEKEKLVMEEMVHKFEMDDLTQTYTRQAFFHYSELLLKETEKKYVVAIVDIDNFKITHSKYGENICNDFLKYLADYLTKLFPTGYVGRFSSSKYSIICDYKGWQEIEVEKIIDSEMIKESPMPNQILKLGVYESVDNSIGIRRCCDRVLLALTKIRGIYGQNISYYEDSLENQLLDDHMIEEYMEVALSKNQFKVFYQPKHDTASKKLVGAEALVRWIHPKYGFMSPGQFIPIFERTGFITKMDAYVFETVCSDIKEWKDKGLEVPPISINISRKDFYEEGWIDQRLSLVDSLGIDTKLLHMEVTETLYAEDTDVIKEKVKHIKEKGIKIEMDDFGSGYSSLGMLANMSLDVLKLDISFVRNIDVTDVVVESIIKLAHRLNLTVIAEGVETEAQYQVVKKHGCDVIQGFYFAKPMPSDEFADYLR